MQTHSFFTKIWREKASYLITEDLYSAQTQQQSSATLRASRSASIC